MSSFGSISDYDFCVWRPPCKSSDRCGSTFASKWIRPPAPRHCLRRTSVEKSKRPAIYRLRTYDVLVKKNGAKSDVIFLLSDPGFLQR